MAGTSRSGRKPKPAGLRELHGSKVRPYHRREPKYAALTPAMPPHIAADALALEKWGILAERLAQSRVLTIAHGEALAVLAEAWADYVRCREQFAQTGRQMLVVDEKRGADGTMSRKVRDNPLIRRSERLAMLLQRYLSEFGLTPVSGPKVAAGSDSDNHEWDEFFDGLAKVQ